MYVYVCVCLLAPGLYIETDTLISRRGYHILRLEVKLFFRLLLQLLNYILFQGGLICFHDLFPQL